MTKIILLFHASNMLMTAQAFFINARDIGRFFGIAPTLYDSYRKEASQNYPQDEHEEKPDYPNQHKKYENNINEKLPPTGYYYKTRPSENIYEYVRDYSNKEENSTPYVKNEDKDKNCDVQFVRRSERDKDSSNGHNPRVYLQLPPTLSKLKEVQAERINREKNKEFDTGNIDHKNKDFISGVLVALPNFNVKELLREPNSKNKNDKYFIKALFSNTPQPVYAEENNQPDNIFFR